MLTVVRISSIFGVGNNVFAPGDSVFAFADNNERVDDDDVWITASVTDVDSSVVVCPADGVTIAQEVTFGGQSAIFTADSVRMGAPVRSFGTYTFGTTTLDGDTYFARREGAGRMIPVAGPIRDTGGLQFVYRDRFGAETTVDTLVAQIEVTVRTGSEVLNSLGEMVSDSITSWIYTRN